MGRRLRTSRAAGACTTESSGPAVNQQSRRWAYYRSIAWDKWWTEFCTSRQKNGRMTYITAWQFVKAKAEQGWQKPIIWHCIGPKPIVLPGESKKRKARSNRLPYLGDWQVLRAKAYFFDSESLDKMRTVVAERLDGLEAGRGSATVILDLIAKWVKYDDKVDEQFNYSPVEEGLGLRGQEMRADLFFKLKRKTLNAILELVDKYLNCHGIQHDGVNDLGALVLAAGQSAARAALAGTVTGQALQEQVPPALNALNRAMMEKSRIFNLPLPAALVEDNEK